MQYSDDDDDFSQSEKQSFGRFSNLEQTIQSIEPSNKSEESLTELIKKKRLLLQSGLKDIEHNDATFDLSDTLHDTKNQQFTELHESTLESRIQRLEDQLSQSYKLTKQKKQLSPNSPSITSVDSFSIEQTQYKEKKEKQPSQQQYQSRFYDIPKHQNKKSDTIGVDWKNQRKLDDFDGEIQNLYQELDQLKNELQKDEEQDQRKRLKWKDQLKQFNKKSQHEEIDLYSDKKHNQRLKSEQDQQITHHLPPPPTQKNKNTQDDISFHDNSIIQQPTKSFKQTEVSLDVIPQKDVYQPKNQGRNELSSTQQLNEKENQKPEQTTQIREDNISRLYKLNKEVDILKKIERIKKRLENSITQKIESEKVIEKYDISYRMPSKTKLPNQSTRSHCPNCAYLLNKGVKTIYCSCHK